MERHASFIQFSGDGSTLTFLIPHGCSIQPYFITTEASTKDALGTARDNAGNLLMDNVKSYAADVTSNPGNITIIHQVAPPTGTNNLGYFWSAECS